MKNRLMKTACVLLALVLVTSCMVGGTFAKYTTTGSAADTARVAKWGIVITPNGNLFNATYAKAEGTTITGENSVHGKSVSGETTADADVVAPGTEGSLSSVSIGGSPEVALEVKYEAELTLLGWTLADQKTVYCPIVVTITNGDQKTVVQMNEQITTLDQFETAVEDAINAFTANYAPNQDMSKVSAPVVSWAWPIGEGNANDTYLGDRAAADRASKIQLKITTTVTQLD